MGQGLFDRLSELGGLLAGLLGAFGQLGCRFRGLFVELLSGLGQFVGGLLGGLGSLGKRLFRGLAGLLAGFFQLLRRLRHGRPGLFNRFGSLRRRFGHLLGRLPGLGFDLILLTGHLPGLLC
jgi:hypothetical protein